MTENADARTRPEDEGRADEVTGMMQALRERRALVDAGKEERRQSEDAALERFAATAVAIEAAWTEGARRVEELELEAERVRDEVRERAADLEAEQQFAIAELARVRPAEDVAALLGMPLDAVRAIIVRTPVPEQADSPEDRADQPVQQ